MPMGMLGGWVAAIDQLHMGTQTHTSPLLICNIGQLSIAAAVLGHTSANPKCIPFLPLRH